MRIVAVLFAILAWTSSSAAQPREPVLVFDHVWIAVAPGGPEREAFERAGFRVGPVERRDGLGAASIAIAFRNGSLEFLWLDPSVPIARGNEAFVEQLRNRAAWRDNGWSPIGVALHRTAGAPNKLPFESWPVSTPNGAIEVLTPRAQGQAVSLFVVPRASAFADGSFVEHPNSAERITKVSIAAPGAAYLPAVARRIGDETLEFVVGPEWLVEITLDSGMKQRSRDFGPALPLVIHF